MSSEKPACLVLRDKVPTGWDVCLLQDVTDFQEGPGILAKDFHESGVPLLRLRNIETSTVKLDGCNYLDPKKVATKWAHFALRENDLLISTSASLGRVSVVDLYSAGAIAYTGIIRFRSSDSTRLDRGYLRAFLSSAAFVEQAEQMATGSVIRHFGPSHLKQMAISLPSLSEQRQIAGISDAIEHRIALLRETNTTLEAIAQTLFKSWFVDFDPVYARARGEQPAGLAPEVAALFPDSFEESDLGMVPKGWRAGVFRDVCIRIESGGTPKRSVPEYWGGDVSWLSSGEVRSDIVFDTKETITDLGVKQSSAKLWPQGTTVVAMYGATAGEVCLLARPTTANQACCGLIPKPQARAFMFMCARRERAALASKSSGSAQQNLNKGLIESHPLVLPPIELLSTYEESAGALLDCWIANDHQAQTLASLRDTLLPRLISGQLRLPDAEQQLKDLAV
ncbi:restriction endonuclease subunit S [Aeromonas veronii]